MYAIIRTGGKQYKVTEGETLDVSKLDNELKKEIIFNEVLFVSKNNEFKVGAPLVENAKVVAVVVEQGKEKKVVSFKYKPKTGFHKKIGHRQDKTTVKIIKIEC